MKKDRSLISDLEKNAILQTESNGQKWTKKSNLEKYEHWVRKDGAEAVFVFDGSIMILQTKAFSKSTDY